MKGSLTRGSLRAALASHLQRAADRNKAWDEADLDDD